MPPAFLASVGTGVISAANTALNITPGATIAPGTTLLALLATNGAVGDVASMADNSTQPGDANNYQYAFTRAGNAGGNIAQHVFLCQVRRTVLNTDTITFTLPSTSRWAATIQSYTGFVQPLIIQKGSSLLTTGTSIAPNPGIPRDNPTQAIQVMSCADNTPNLAGLGAPSNGFTMRATAVSAGGSVDKACLLADLVPGVVGTTSTAVTDTATTGWSAIMFAVEEGAFASNPLNAHRRAYTQT